ncbi:glycosyltransferase family 4 protein [Prochlorococcus sp. AH-736-M13]|nr:glycosyltransferase family 1 protein [Prochlorococcus sp. AH-736-M13]MDA9746861.1 glycosyltransferase family 4 protein [Prochlorococcus sp. AH-736-M13]
MMKLKNNFVALDLRYLEKENTGLARYSINISKYLINNNEKLKFIVILPPEKYSIHLKDYVNDIKNNSDIIYWDQKRLLRWKFPFFIIDAKLYYFLLRRKIRVFFCPYIDPPLLPGINVISTIHDTTPIDVKDYFQNLKFLKKSLYAFRLLITLYTSNLILTVSNSSKNRLIAIYSKHFLKLKSKLENIKIIPNGVYLNRYKKDNFVHKTLKKYNLSKKKYFLYVGDRRPHKNIESIINLINLYNKKFNEDFQLILAGSNSYKNFKLLSKIKNHKSFVIEIVNPNDIELDYLYKECEALCFLSLSEGFGIPILEAAIRGKKIIANKMPIFEEIAPPESLLIDIKNFESALDQMNEYLNNKSFPNKKDIEKKWCWENSASLLSKILLTIIN